MARTESRTKTAIWSDKDFIKLSGNAQRCYWLLYSQPTILLCGVLAITVRRWARTASDSSTETVEAALVELEEADFIVVDRDTEELLVRSFAKHDGVGKSDKTRWAAYRQLHGITSPIIRTVAEAGLRALGPPPDDWRDTPSDTPSHGAPDTPSHTPSDRGYQARNPVDNPQPDTPSDTPPDTSMRARARRRLSPPPVSCLLSPAGQQGPADPPTPHADTHDGPGVRPQDGNQDQDSTGDPGLDRLVARWVDAVDPPFRNRARAEARWRLPSLRSVLDDLVIDECIGRAAAESASPPRSIRYLEQTCRSWARQNAPGLVIPDAPTPAKEA